MSKKDTLRIPDYLEHILAAIKRIQHYTDDMDGNGFLANEMVQDAVIRNIEVIGEAARNIEFHHPDFAKKHSHIPWEDIYLMRNRVSHGYFSVDLEIIWATIERDLPLLEQQIQTVYQQVKHL